MVSPSQGQVINNPNPTFAQYAAVFPGPGDHAVTTRGGAFCTGLDKMVCSCGLGQRTCSAQRDFSDLPASGGLASECESEKANRRDEQASCGPKQLLA